LSLETILFTFPLISASTSKHETMKKLILLFLLVAASIQLKAQTPTTPVEMNNYLMEMVNNLYERGKQWGANFNNARESKDFASLSADRKALETFVNQSIKDVEKLKDIKGSKMLRMAMLDFLQFEKDMVENAFLPIEKLDNESSDEEIDTALQKLLGMAKYENEWLDKVRAEQKKYAEANNFTLE
jgi:hypothetical protein